MSIFKYVYQRFINLAIAPEQLSDLPLLDPIEKRLLPLLSHFWSNNKNNRDRKH